MFGGAAGGGKSVALLMAALQYVEEPGYTRAHPAPDVQAALEGRLDPEQVEGVALGSGEVQRRSSTSWWFPSATRSSSGTWSTRTPPNYRSSEFQFIGVDEGTQFTEFQLRYLFSRLRRRKNVPVPLRYRIGTNPGGPSHEFIKRRYIKRRGRPARQFVPARLDDNPGIDRASYLI
jgi:hypothetical protein